MSMLLAPIAQAREPIGPIVEQLHMPVTYIYGESDWMGPVRGARAVERMRADGKDAHYVLIPNAGHYSFLDQPAHFNQALLDRVAPSSAAAQA